MIRAFVGSALLVLATNQIASKSDLLALTGHLVYLESRGETDFKRDRALYAHDNLQFIVIEVERSVFGENFSGHAIVGISVDDRNVAGTVWFSPSYGVLDAKVWEQGMRVLVIGVRTDAGGKECSPSLSVRTEATGEATIGDDTSKTYDDEGLRKYQGAPVICASVRNVFVLRER